MASVEDGVLKTVVSAVLPVFAAIAATAVVACYLDDIAAFLFGGPATGGQRFVMIAILFLPVSVALALVESMIRRNPPGTRRRDLAARKSR